MQSILPIKSESSKGNRMKIVMPSFGFISAIATSTVFLPHALVILGVLFFHHGLKDPSPILLFFTLVAKVTADWLFWVKFFPQEMDSGENRSDWRSSVKDIMASQPPAIKSVLDMIIDTAVDVTLICMAYKASAPPMWILFVFSACQAVGAPIQGMILRIFERKNVRVFSMIVTALATFLAFEINGFMSNSYTQMLGLTHFSSSIQILIILGAKCLLAETSVISKETIAEVLKIETIKNPEKYGIQPNGR